MSILRRLLRVDLLVVPLSLVVVALAGVGFGLGRGEPLDSEGAPGRTWATAVACPLPPGPPSQASAAAIAALGDREPPPIDGAGAPEVRTATFALG